MKYIFSFLFLLLCFSGFSQNQEHFEPLKCGHLSHTNQTQFNSAMDNYDVTCYIIDITATNLSTHIEGSTSIYANSMVNGISTFVFELNNQIVIDSVLVNNLTSPFSRSEFETTVTLNETINKGDQFIVTVYYTRPATLDTDGIFNRFVDDWGDNVTFTLSEPYHAREWFPVKQDLYDKADSVYVFVTVDKDLKVGSNGLLTNRVNIGDTMLRYEWKSYYPIAYYLISFAVAEYEEYNFYAHPNQIAPDSILVQNYLYKDYSENEYIKEEFDWTDELIELFSEKYSIYPFWKEKYGHSFVPLGGAMEHQTMTTTGSSEFYINAHELGHQWFGDQVTCATWQDIWINEGFASYSEYLGYEFLQSKEVAQDHLINAQYYAREAKTGSVYVPFEELEDEDRIFDWRLTYRKGLCLVHMIRNEINDDDKFFELLQGFQLSFADGVATGDDLKNYLNNNSEVNFDLFFEEWYYGEGYPTYRVRWDTVNTQLQFYVEQTTESSNTPFFTSSIPISIKHGELDTLIRIKPSKLVDTISFDSLIMGVGEVSTSLDPLNWLLKGQESYVQHVDDKTSLTDAKLTSLLVGPNPVSEILKISAQGTRWNEMVIMDMLGKVFWKSSNYQESVEINTQSWKPGVYIVSYKGDSEQGSIKLIKQ